MILSMSNQAVIFLLTVCIGLGAGLVYDVFRLLRFYIRHPDFFTHLEDLVYWLFVATVMFYIFLNKNYGEIRAFCVLGVVSGMVFYFSAASRLVMFAVKSVITFLGKVLAEVVKVVLLPLKLLKKLFARPANFLVKIFSNIHKSVKKMLQNFKNYVKIKARFAAKDIEIMTKKV